MATVLEQMRDDESHRFAAVAAAVQRRVEEQVDPGVAVFRLGLLPVLDQPCNCTVDLDRETRRLWLIERELLLRQIPPAGDAGRAVDPP